MDEKLYGVLSKHDEWQSHLVGKQCNEILRHRHKYVKFERFGTGQGKVLSLGTAIEYLA